MVLFEANQMKGTRRIDEMIADARRLAYAETYTYTEGWNENTLVTIFNQGLDRLYHAITQIDNPANVMQLSLDTVAGQSEYDLPIDVFMAFRLVDVRYIWGTVPYEYVTLVQGDLQDRFPYPTNIPSMYFTRDGKINLTPTPNQTKANSLVINFQHRVRKLDVRRGAVQYYFRAGLGWSLGPWSYMTWSRRTTPVPEYTFHLTFNSPSEKNAQMQANANSTLDYVDYCCLVDQYGESIVQAIPLSYYNQITQDLVTTRDYVLPELERIALDNALETQMPVYVVQGDYASTHTGLDREAETHLIEYAVLRLLRLQSNAEEISVQMDTEQKCLDQLINAYRRQRKSVYPVIFTKNHPSQSWPMGTRSIFY